MHLKFTLKSTLKYSLRCTVIEFRFICVYSLYIYRSLLYVFVVYVFATRREKRPWLYLPQHGCSCTVHKYSNVACFPVKPNSFRVSTIFFSSLRHVYEHNQTIYVIYLSFKCSIMFHMISFRYNKIYSF